MRLLAILLSMISGVSASFAQEIVPLTVEAGNNTYHFQAEVADDAAERAQGLMFREQLADDAGMLFLYPDERPRTFWMRNTPLALDIIFIGADGRVVDVAADARPFDDTTIPSRRPAQAALEIRAGLAAMLGIAPGARISWPPRATPPSP